MDLLWMRSLIKAVYVDLFYEKYKLENSIHKVITTINWYQQNSNYNYIKMFVFLLQEK
jgi:hypothetical protein